MKASSRFASWLFTLAPRAATARDMLDRFGPTSPVGRQFIGWCYDNYSKFSSYGIVGESFAVWKGLYKEATNLDKNARSAVKAFALNLGMTKPDVEQFLFSVETYMAVLMKLLVAGVALQKNLLSSPSLRVLLGADAVGTYRSLAQRFPFLRNIFEEDIFDWFLEPAKDSKGANDQAKANLTDISDALDNLDFTNLRTDLIRELYHGFFDADTRRALGEFYTNDAVVDEVLDRIGYRGIAKSTEASKLLLDPSCGSGTFLVRAIARWSPLIRKVKGNRLEESQLLEAISNSVVGIDIHPFAVAMARANYILGIIDLLSPAIISHVGGLSIPIYWTDSLVIRETAAPRIDKGPTYNPVEIGIPVLGKFVLPRPEDIDWEFLASNVRKGLDSKWTEGRFLAEFPETQRLVYREILTDLYRWFVQRNKDGKDGRWISVLTNAVVVYKLQQKCQYVVGNPPWVRIHHIDGLIRDRLKEKFSFYRKGWSPNFAKTKPRFKEQYDYCMAFVESGLRLLSPSGKLGFVITSKIMQTQYAGSMRKSLLEQSKLLHLRDYSLSGVELFRNATNYPLIMALQKAEPAANEVAIEMVSHGATRSWKAMQSQLPVSLDDSMSPWMLAPPEVVNAFRKMQIHTHEQGFTKNRRIGDTYDVIRGVMTSLNEIFLVTEIKPSATSGLVVATTEGGEKIVIEKELLRPVLRGEDITATGFKPAEHIIWTHDDRTAKVLEDLPENAKKHFLAHKYNLAKRDGYDKTKPIWTIFRVTKAKLGTKVAWPELERRMDALELPPTYPDSFLGKRTLIPLQTVYLVAVSRPDEGRRLMKILNSTPVRAFMSSFAERARGGYFRHISWTVGLVPLPNDFEKIDASNPNNDGVTAKVFGLDAEELKTVVEFYGFVSGRTLPNEQ